MYVCVIGVYRVTDARRVSVVTLDWSEIWAVVTLQTLRHRDFILLPPKKR